MRHKGLTISIWVVSLLIGLFLGTAYAEPMSIATAMVLSGLISAGGGIAGGLLSKNGGEEEWDPQYLQLPDYPEATGAREGWWSKLQEWGNQPGYGALPMNWEDIKKNATDTLNRYYWGGVTDPGLEGKMQANAAKRGMPVNENMINALGMQEKIDLNELMTSLRTEEVQYGEKGRQTWLSSMMNLAGLKPSFITNAGVSNGSTTYGAGEAIGDVSSGIGSLFSQYAKSKSQEELLTKLFEQYGGSGGTTPTAQTSLTSDFNLGSLTELLNKTGYKGY